MPDIADGAEVEVQGSGVNTYTLSNTGGTYRCTCPVWKFQRLPINLRTCKHLRAYRGDEAETTRTRGASPPPRGGNRPAVAGSATLPGKTTAPKLLLAHRWKNDIDISGWWLSEKLDGVRAYWDGERFWSRLGNEYLAPEWFTEKFPSMPMDGELFVGRGMFQKTVSIVRRQDRSDDWRDVRFLVFDAPGENAVFEERIRTIEAVLSATGSPYVTACAHWMCDDADHLEEELRRVEELGAEGLMLRQPGSPYQAGRSWTLLKVKSFWDAEARVLEHIEGTGKHMGRLGACMCELPSGVKFKVGTGYTDEQRENPPAIGSLITFRYQELTDGGVPRFPSFIGERIDLSWEQLSDPRRASPTDGAASRLRTLNTPALGASAPVIQGEKPAAAAARPTRAAPPALPPPDIDPSGNVYLEFTRGSSVKFWEIEWDGKYVYIEYGRVDKPPKTTTKTFERGADAGRYVEKQIKAKREKGYVDEL